MQLTAEARYLYGAPLRGGKLTWRVYRRGRDGRASRSCPAFEFGDARSWYDDYAVALVACPSRWSARRSSSWTRHGRAKLTLKLDRRTTSSRAQDLMVTAEVQDETHQTIAANVAIPAHPAGALLRHRPRQPDRRARAARAPIKVVAVDTKGEPVAGAAHLPRRKRDWSCA